MKPTRALTEAMPDLSLNVDTKAPFDAEAGMQPVVVSSTGTTAQQSQVCCPVDSCQTEVSLWTVGSVLR